MLPDLKSLSSGGRSPAIFTDWIWEKEGGACPELGEGDTGLYRKRVSGDRAGGTRWADAIFCLCPRGGGKEGEARI